MKKYQYNIKYNKIDVDYCRSQCWLVKKNYQTYILYSNLHLISIYQDYDEYIKQGGFEMAKMKKTYSYEWYGPCGYEEKEDSKDGASEEVHERNAFTSRVIPYERGFHVFRVKPRVSKPK